MSETNITNHVDERRDVEADAPARPRLLTVRQAAAYLGLPPDTVYSFVHAGHLEHVRVTDRGRIWFEVEQLDRFIAQHRRAATVPPRPEQPPVPRPYKDVSALMPTKRYFS